jgi:hypothetical protein
MAPSGAAPDAALNPPTRSDAATFAIARKSSGKSARPVFVDILPESWCIDPELAEAAITPRTKAIVALHLYSNLCEMDGLLAVGQKHGIPVIDDAVEAIGSIYHGKRAGSMVRLGLSRFTVPRRSPLVRAACSVPMTATSMRKCNTSTGSALGPTA